MAGALTVGARLTAIIINAADWGDDCNTGVELDRSIAWNLVQRPWGSVGKDTCFIHTSFRCGQVDSEKLKMLGVVGTHPMAKSLWRFCCLRCVLRMQCF